jgi:hypothetical protein
MREWVSAHIPIHQNISIASFIIQKQACLASFPIFFITFAPQIKRKENGN